MHLQWRSLLHKISRIYYRYLHIFGLWECNWPWIKCAIPVFEGLLGKEHNHTVMVLLFELATWHSFAKLRLHTETTVCSLDTSTTQLGIILRKFRDHVCPIFETYDLPSDEAAWGRRQAASAAKKKKGPEKQTTQAKSCTSHVKRTFNMSTYKLHALGVYASAIRRYGTTDNYSTQTVGYSYAKLTLHRTNWVF